eukprot:1678610-Pyramimonas_sp.AAC.1
MAREAGVAEPSAPTAAPAGTSDTLRRQDRRGVLPVPRGPRLRGGRARGPPRARGAAPGGRGAFR